MRFNSFKFYRFFVVEDTIMHTCQSISHKGETEGLVSQLVLDEFWDMATSEMLSVLRQHCVSIIYHFFSINCISNPIFLVLLTLL